MTDETESMLKTLIWTIGMIAQSQPKDRERIALAYQEAQELVAGVPKDHGDVRPRIEACFKRSDAYRAADDVACVGWILTAIQERVNERNLPGWPKLRKVVKEARKLLPSTEPTVH